MRVDALDALRSDSAILYRFALSKTKSTPFQMNMREMSWKSVWIFLAFCYWSKGKISSTPLTATSRLFSAAQCTTLDTCSPKLLSVLTYVFPVGL